MPPLAEFQRGFIEAVMGGKTPLGLFTGRVPVAEALSIHRDTVLGALVNALRLSYPTVEALVGADFFDHAAGIFAAGSLPSSACLVDYGDGFADFLAGFEPAAPLAYLPDVARLDRAVETVLRAPAGNRRIALDASAGMELPRGLAVLFLAHPADEIRAGLGDDTALAQIDMASADRFVLVWRKGTEAAVRRVGPAAGQFLISLLAGEPTTAALGAAAARTSEAEAMRAIQSDIFAAPFCTVISTAKELSP